MKRVILANILTIIGFPLFLFAMVIAGAVEFGAVIVFVVGALYLIFIGYLARCTSCQHSLFMRGRHFSAPWASFKCRQCGHNQQHSMTENLSKSQ
jgi:DNA-directed RNA polymerase subunit RPC12/RpoP